MNAWLEHWEPLWLFIVLTYEALIGTATFIILIIEYHYDKSFNDAMKEARRNRRRKSYEFETLTEGESK